MYESKVEEFRQDPSFGSLPQYNILRLFVKGYPAGFPLCYRRQNYVFPFFKKDPF